MPALFKFTNNRGNVVNGFDEEKNILILISSDSMFLRK